MPDGQLGPSASSPEHPLSPRFRPGLRCIGSGCETLVLHGRICDACLTATAIALTQKFEGWLLADGLIAGTADLRAALAGYATSKPLSWYQQFSGLGEIGWNEAVAVRRKTDIACFLVALGGAAALTSLPGAEVLSDAVRAWTGEDSAPEPQPGVVGVLEMEAEDFLRSGDEPQREFYLADRIDAGVVQMPPEQKFEIGYALVMAALFLLLLVTR